MLHVILGLKGQKVYWFVIAWEVLPYWKIVKILKNSNTSFKKMSKFLALFTRKIVFWMDIFCYKLQTSLWVCWGDGQEERHCDGDAKWTYHNTNRHCTRPPATYLHKQHKRNGNIAGCCHLAEPCAPVYSLPAKDYQSWDWLLTTRELSSHACYDHNASTHVAITCPTHSPKPDRRLVKIWVPLFLF